LNRILFRRHRWAEQHEWQYYAADRANAGARALASAMNETDT
jgi:hypothetical protein